MESQYVWQNETIHRFHSNKKRVQIVNNAAENFDYKVRI